MSARSAVEGLTVGRHYAWYTDAIPDQPATKGDPVRLPGEAVR